MERGFYDCHAIGAQERERQRQRETEKERAAERENHLLRINKSAVACKSRHTIGAEQQTNSIGGAFVSGGLNRCALVESCTRGSVKITSTDERGYEEEETEDQRRGCCCLSQRRGKRLEGQWKTQLRHPE